MLSDAAAEMETVPVTIAPASGLVSEAVGEFVSGLGGGGAEPESVNEWIF